MSGLGRYEECYECFRTLPLRNRPISTVSGCDVNGHLTSTYSGTCYQDNLCIGRKVAMNNKRFVRSINLNEKVAIILCYLCINFYTEIRLVELMRKLGTHSAYLCKRTWIPRPLKATSYTVCPRSRLNKTRSLRSRQRGIP